MNFEFRRLAILGMLRKRISNFESITNGLILNSGIENSLPIDSAQGPEFIEGKIENWKLEISQTGGLS